MSLHKSLVALKNHSISYHNNRIILSHERREQATMEIYPSNHLLTFIRSGLLNVEVNGETRSYSKGEFVLFKKFAPARITKTWGRGGSMFSSVVFTFQEDLVQKALMQMEFDDPGRQDNQNQNIIAIHSNPILDQFIQSLELFFEQKVEMDHALANLKTMEVLVGLIRSNKSIFYELQSFAQRSIADLYQYMQYHYREKKSLEEFARDSGRSLTTFKKEFFQLFQTSPGRWLKMKRLDHAYRLLKFTNRKASEVYLECGFEDLAHFSKSFKKQFNVNPSELATV